MSITSDWGDWLPRAVERADPDGLSLWYLGCNGFLGKTAGGTTFAIDPYLGTGDPPRTIRMIPVPFEPADVGRMDAVFATHEHTDHVHGPTQAPILADSGAPYYAPDASQEVVSREEWTREWAVEADQFVTVAEGETVTVGDLTVHVEPARDPDAVHPVAYVLEYEDTTVVHAGDARPGGFGDLGERYDIDLGVVAFGSVGSIPDKDSREPTRTKWYNDENMVVEVANELHLDRVLPTHWDVWKGLTADPSVLSDHARSFPYPERVDVREIGDRIDL